MTYQDYRKWAEEYRNTADTLERKIQQRKQKIQKKCYGEDKQLVTLFQMKNDCLHTMKELLRKADEVRKNDSERIFKSGENAKS